MNHLLEEILSNKKIREDGGYIGIPWLSMPKLSKIIPGILKKRYINITANSKVGKTQLCDFMYVHEPIRFVKTHPEFETDLKILYFSLEVGAHAKQMQNLSHTLFKKYNISIAPQNLKSEFSEYVLQDDLLPYIYNCQEDLDFYNNVLTYIDSIRNPFGIYKYVRDFAHSRGEYYDKENKLLDKQRIIQGDESVLIKIDKYVPNNKNEHVIVIIDHLSLLQPEIINGKIENLHSAMSRFSNTYCLRMRDRWNYTVVGVQQQAADQEKQQFTRSGENIIDKLKPSPDGLGDNKLIGRDVDLMLGLFAPYRYKINKYEGLNMVKLGDHYRELSVLLNRHGGGIKSSLDLLFNGAANVFMEFPDFMLSDDELLTKIKANAYGV